MGCLCCCRVRVGTPDSSRDRNVSYGQVVSFFKREFTKFQDDTGIENGATGRSNRGTSLLFRAERMRDLPVGANEGLELSALEVEAIHPDDDRDHNEDAIECPGREETSEPEVERVVLKKAGKKICRKCT